MKAAYLAGAALLALTACMRGGLNLTPGPIQLYDGPKQPADSLALIENDPNMFIVSIDSQDLRRREHAHDVLSVNVVPGRHVLISQPSERAGFRSFAAARIEFVAQKGHRYVISRRVTGSVPSLEWQAVFTDRTTGKELLP